MYTIERAFPAAPTKITLGQRRNIAAAIGGWSTRHRKLAIFGWLTFVVVAVFLGSASGQSGLANYQQLAGGSAQAEKILDQAGIQGPSGEVVLVQSRGPSGPSSSPAFRRAVDATVAAVSSTGLAYDIESPYRDHMFSAGGRAALVTFDVKPGDDGKIGAVLAAVGRAQAANPGFSLQETGDASGNQALNNLLGSNFAREEWTAVPLALGILLVAFGALVAALLPVMLALSAFLASLGLADLLSHAVGLGTYANSVMLLMGLAVGVDYSLFYLRRERQERRAGRSNEDALAVAAATSGRSVLVSGLVVMTGMAGMLISGVGTFVGLGVAAMLVVLVAMLASVTVLPAVLSWLGDRVERGRVQVRPRRAHLEAAHLEARAGGGPAASVTNRLVGRVLAHPALSALGAGVLVLTLAAPALGMHTETLDLAQLLPYSNPQAATARQLAAEFPGAPSPAAVVIKAPRISAVDVREHLAAFEHEALASGDLRPTFQLLVYPRANVEIVQAPLAGDGVGATSQHALQSLRDDIVPTTLGRVAGVQAYVTGDLAESLDYNAALHRAAVEAFVFVLVTAFVIMLVGLRSLAIAAVTLVLDGLSVAVAYGIMTAVFQHGWGASLVGTHAVGAIESWIPLFLFAVLFGLSMDYHVFVVSRIREARDRGLPTPEAVREGLGASAGVVTSAAAIMVAVFGVFATLSVQDFKQLGVGLAASILADATVVRVVLLPSLITLMGERAWYLPRWMSRGSARRPVNTNRAAAPAIAASCPI
ncbi:MAG TPA: MMPL family transporter, partial [Acidimicrobiales bacterium]|nr:MMPL family transporter [Acidimicrobiales bacterium]